MKKQQDGLYRQGSLVDLSDYSHGGEWYKGRILTDWEHGLVSDPVDRPVPYRPIKCLIVNKDTKWREPQASTIHRVGDWIQVVKGYYSHIYKSEIMQVVLIDYDFVSCIIEGYYTPWFRASYCVPVAVKTTSQTVKKVTPKEKQKLQQAVSAF